MNCCDQTGTGAGCNQGCNCPVRAARVEAAGEAYPLPILHASDELKPDPLVLLAYRLLLVVLALSSVLIVFGELGYLYGRWLA